VACVFSLSGGENARSGEPSSIFLKKQISLGRFFSN
jgi:hypothetical protein